MTDAPLRILFAGTPDFASLHLKALIESEHTLIGVCTQPDRPAGRGKKLTASPVKRLALEAGLPVYQPASLKAENDRQLLADLQADVMVVVAYGLILPQPVLDMPHLGCLNVHASLLPRWRGAAPIQRAIEAGDRQSGITIMQMDAGLDTGDMLASASCPIRGDTTAASLHDELAALGAPLLLQVLADLQAHQQGAQEQDDAKATYAGKILKQEAAINWQQDALTLDRRIRAFNPFPVCFSTLGGERVKLWQAHPVAGEAGEEPDAGTIISAGRDGITVRCGSGCLKILSLQLPGGKALSAEQVLNARREQFAPGQKFETTPRDNP